MPPAVHGQWTRPPAIHTVSYTLPSDIIKENEDHPGSKCIKTGRMSTQNVSSMTSTQRAAAKTSINVTFTAERSTKVNRVHDFRP